MAPPSIPRIALTTASAVARRPDLWATALRSSRSLVPEQWWRHAPHLPIPDRRWLRFRLVTAYGGEGRFDGNTAVRADDVVAWLDWQKHYSP